MEKGSIVVRVRNTKKQKVYIWKDSVTLAAGMCTTTELDEPFLDCPVYPAPVEGT